jgi:hypothetical protein
MKILWLGLERSIGVDALLMNKNTFDLEKIKEYQPDLVIEREFNAPGLDWANELPLIKSVAPNVTTAVWLIDTHVKEDFHTDYCKLFDFAFFAISAFAEKIPHPNGYWLPLCFPATITPEQKPLRDHFVGFVGSYGTQYLENRTEFYRMLKDIYPNFFIVRDYATVYQRMATITYMVNLSYNADMNFRTFESLACGCGLLTSDAPDLYKVQGLVEKIAIFKSFEECVELIRQKENIPVVNHSAWILENHSLKNRVESIVQMVETKQQCSF